ncbi:hypothetical protein FA15DRAFT_759118 [Coprinopsis marcescibilis]|uniref:Uncharacterized protein n=1 Tax=Coprinopsis marcescibilis TaxID=230819 RepID=A0A5C3KLI2_COPMA|nr:hypothetical protein FA15DRAFT_759118 [Coprinopsis marcescibilis]
MQCTLCPKLRNGQHPTIWKYNFWLHLAAVHSDEETREIIDLPLETIIAFRVGRYEEALLTIEKAATDAYRETHHIPDTDPPNPDEPPWTSTSELLTVPSVVVTGSDSRKRSLSEVSWISAPAHHPPPPKTLRTDSLE